MEINFVHIESSALTATTNKYSASTAASAANTTINTKWNKKTAIKPRAKKTKIDEEMIEVCAIVYDCASQHPNFNLNECLDQYPIDDICGFGDDVFRDQVNVSKYY
jgi:hypothetical protein